MGSRHGGPQPTRAGLCFHSCAHQPAEPLCHRQRGSSRNAYRCPRSRARLVGGAKVAGFYAVPEWSSGGSCAYSADRGDDRAFCDFSSAPAKGLFWGMKTVPAAPAERLLSVQVTGPLPGGGAMGETRRFRQLGRPSALVKRRDLAALIYLSSQNVSIRTTSKVPK